jgi:hypothetical protein
MTFLITMPLPAAVEDSLRRVPRLAALLLPSSQIAWVVLVSNSIPKFSARAREFIFELRNIFVSMEKRFHLVFKNSESIILGSCKAA